MGREGKEETTEVGQKRKGRGNYNVDNIINSDVFLSFTYEVLLPERFSLPKIEGIEEKLNGTRSILNMEHST